MYVLKSVPEDFIVQEIPSLEFKPTGKYLYFWLNKRAYTTLDAVQDIAEFLHLPVHQIGVAGNKDKHAVTKQLCSVAARFKKQLEQFSHKKIWLETTGFGNEQLAAGMLQGNTFKIIVRNADYIQQKKQWFINRFGEQRFSSHNVDIGRALLQKNFTQAITLLQQTHQRFIHPHSDAVHTLRTLPQKILRLTIHAYQSWLWNQAVDLCAKHTTPSETAILQLPGFGFDGDETLRKTYEQLLNKDQLTIDSFVLRALPDLSAEACERNVWIKVTDLIIQQVSPQTILLTFTLPKGSYATEVVRQLFENATY